MVGLHDIFSSKPSSRDKTRIVDWDTKVYAGCVEQIANAFLWTDAHHWEVTRQSCRHMLHEREWNEALKKYCMTSV
jgi:hypothetical protein